MHLVVGLGNPGARYAATRHNAGYRVVERLATRWHLVLAERSAYAEWGVGDVGGTPVVLAKPTTFMNASGDAVAALHRELAPRLIVVASDDLDLPLGRVRIRGGGSAGGHRGVESVIAAIGPEFARVRIGIGRPPPGVEAVDYVLAPFTVEEAAVLSTTLERAADGIEYLVRDGLEAAMRACNAALPE